MTRCMIFSAILALSPGLAGALTLALPAPAVEIGTRTENPARLDLAIAGFDGTKVPARRVEGALDQHAYRMEGKDGNTLAWMQALRAQVTQAGYKVLYECQTTECGGFDFRFAVDILPEPQMHVDLGDYLYLSAEGPAGDVLSLVVSRSAGLGFVQVTTLTVSQAAAPQVTNLVAPTPAADPIVAAPPTPETPAPQVQTPVTGPLGDVLMATGSVALDDLVFASGKSVLETGQYASLATLADWLTAHPGLVVTLVGHTDATGSLAGNTALSKQRAASVRDVLVRQYGIKGAQVDAQGAGYLAPRATNQTEEGRQKNRRVEVMLTSTPGK